MDRGCILLRPCHSSFRTQRDGHVQGKVTVLHSPSVASTGLYLQDSQLQCGCPQSTPQPFRTPSEPHFPQNKFVTDYVGVGIEREEPLPSIHPSTISLPLKSSLSNPCCSPLLPNSPGTSDSFHSGEQTLLWFGCDQNVPQGFLC